MNVPDEVLKKLICERCGGYLSRGPVYLLENSKYRCGRCSWIEGLEEEGIRLTAYEELAKLMCFPCVYKINGCRSTVPFMENKRHEDDCPYREIQWNTLTDHASEEQRRCKNLPCTYRDIIDKCEVHESFFCTYITKCNVYMCSANISSTTLYAHYMEAHPDITLRAGIAKTMNAILLLGDWETYFSIFGFHFGRVVCSSGLTDSDFSLWMDAPIPAAQLHMYQCRVELSNPQTGHTHTALGCTPDVGDHYYDWYMSIPRAEYNACVHENLINIKINISQ